MRGKVCANVNPERKVKKKLEGEKGCEEGSPDAEKN